MFATMQHGSFFFSFKRGTMPTTAAGEEVRDELDVTGMINGKKVFACSVRSLRAHKKSLIYLGVFFFFQ